MRLLRRSDLFIRPDYIVIIASASPYFNRLPVTSWRLDADLLDHVVDPGGSTA